MGLKDKLFGKKNDTAAWEDESESSGAIKIAEGVAKILSIGSDKKDPTEPQTDTQVFLSFLKDYVKELGRKD